MATITYLSKFTNTNTSTAPTAPQASQLTTQVAQVFFLDTDTQAIIVHNWGVLLGPSFATFQWPLCSVIKILGAAADFSWATNFTWGLTNSNQVYLNKPVGTGTGGTYIVYLQLPISYMAKA